MKSILIATVLAISLLLIPSAVGATGIEVINRTGDGTWVGKTWEVSLYAGESKATTLTLRNPYNNSLEIWVTITPSSLDNGNVTFGLDEVNFIMPAGSEANVTLTVIANSSATPNIYTAELEIKSEAPPAPIGGGGTTPLYPVETNLFGIEKTYYTEYSGDLQKMIEGTSQDGNLTVTIPSRTIALGEDGRRLKTLEVAIDESPPAPPEDTNIIGLAYKFNPVGATFSPAITFTWSYDPDDLPKGVAEKDLVLAYYDEAIGKWVKLDCEVDTANNTITASVKHFTTFAIIGLVLPPLVPAPVPAPTPITEPEPAPPVAPTPTPIPAPLPEPEPEPIVVPPVVPPMAPEAPPWGLIGGLIGAVILVGIIIWLVRRHRKANY